MPTSLEAIAQKLEEKRKEILEEILKVSGSAAISKNDYGITVVDDTKVASSLIFKELHKDKYDNLELVKAMRHYDYTVNVTWVMGHLNAAKKYIESGQGSGEATGGSDWKKYMHPKYQRRIFFPELWSEDELKNWGEGL